MKAAFAEIDISPPPGSRKVGWIKTIIGEKVNDPLFGRVAIFAANAQRVAFIQLDVINICDELCKDIRHAIESSHGFPSENIMVSATHNHAGPAVSDVGEVQRDEAYCATLVQKLINCFGAALANMQEADIGFGRALNWQLAKNRRVVMRDGTVKTHGNFADLDAMYIEGPIDPETIVLAARNKSGQLLGILVNYACHATHLGGESVFSAGWPGVMALEMKKRACPVTMFLNGAEAQMHHHCPITGDLSMEQCGITLADSACEAVQQIHWRNDAKINVASRKLNLPFRQFTDDEIHGRTRGAQRFIDPGIYDRLIPSLVEKFNRMGTHPAELQAISFNEYVFISIPGELFVELGLRIKERAHPCKAIIVGLANGMLGYIPIREAFARGGYETTFLDNKKMAPETGDILADTAVELIRLIGRSPT